MRDEDVLERNVIQFHLLVAYLTLSEKRNIKNEMLNISVEGVNI